MNIKIYFFGPMDRSGRVRWLLEELGLPYEDHRLDFMKQEHKSEEYLKINPMGAIPAVDIDGEVLTESGAICTYLADKYIEKNLAPALDSPNRGAYLRWVFFIPCSVEPILNEGFKSSQLPEEERNKVFAQMIEKIQPALNVLSAALKDKDFIVNNTFSVADIMVGSTLNWARQFKLLDNNPELQAYVDKLKTRPALEKSGAFTPIVPS